VSQDLSSVIPTEVEEWSEWDEGHGPLGREDSGERVGRRTSSISEFCRLSAPSVKIQRCLDFARHDTYESETEKFARSSGKQLRFLFDGKVHRLDKLAWFRFAQRKRVIRAERDALYAEELEQQCQRIGVVDE
jgi:hypothetical protein